MLFSKMEQSTEANGTAAKSTAMEYKFGQTEPATKVIGNETKLAAKGSFGTWMVMNLKESGWMIKLKAMEYIFMPMDLGTKGSGNQIYNTVKAKSCGPTKVNTKVSISTVRNTGTEITTGLTAATTSAAGLKIGLKVMALTRG